MTIKTKVAAASVAAVLALCSASAVDAATHHTRMHVMDHMTVMTHSGKEMSLDVVVLNGHKMVLAPADSAPDIFNQMVFRRQ